MTTAVLPSRPAATFARSAIALAGCAKSTSRRRTWTRPSAIPRQSISVGSGPWRCLVLIVALVGGGDPRGGEHQGPLLGDARGVPETHTEDHHGPDDHHHH